MKPQIRKDKHRYFFDSYLSLSVFICGFKVAEEEAKPQMKKDKQRYFFDSYLCSSVFICGFNGSKI
jgi:hypothetical protein